MALSYNLGYQESISVHPTRRQIFAGKPYSTFPNIWEWVPTSENESYRYYSTETFIDISCLRLFPITSTQGALKASRGKSFQSRWWKGWGREGGKLCMRGVTWVTWCVWGVRQWGMLPSSSDSQDTVLDTILETHPAIPSYSIGYTIPCFPILSYTFFHHSLAGHCAGH